MELDAKIEAILFFKAEPMSIDKLVELLNCSQEELTESITKLQEKLTGRGLILVKKDNSIMLGTNPEASQLIENITKEELSKDLGKAGLETLAIIIYEGPISRASIDYIRGVNSSFILRNLMIRGLIEKINNEKDNRSFLYRPTFDLLQNLGIEKIEDLPEFEEVKKKLEIFKEEQKTDKDNEDLN